MSKISTFISAFFIVFFMNYNMSYASHVPNIDIKVNRFLHGNIKNGTHVGIITVSCNEIHAGFRLWVNSDFIENEIGRYVLRGVYNTKNTISLRLDKDGYLPNADGSGWIVLRSLKFVEQFNLVIDGDQEVHADSYNIIVKAEVLH